MFEHIKMNHWMVCLPATRPVLEGPVTDWHVLDGPQEQMVPLPALHPPGYSEVRSPAGPAELNLQSWGPVPHSLCFPCFLCVNYSPQT